MSNEFLVILTFKHLHLQKIDFQNNDEIANAHPLIRLLRVRVNDPSNNNVYTMSMDSNNRVMFMTDVPDCQLENSKYCILVIALVISLMILC